MVKNDKTALDITMLNTMVETYHAMREVFDYKIAVSEDQWYQIMNIPVEALRDVVSSVLISYGIDIDYANNEEADAYYGTVDDILWGRSEPQSLADIVEDYRSRLA